MKKDRERLREAHFIERLRKKYQAPEWAFFDHVPDATGGAANRTADGVAINCWPSRGMAIIGFEIKSYRGDWLAELKNPNKSAAVQKYCDHWYVVTEEDVIKDAELPSTWGHMVPHGRYLKVIKEAPKLQPIEPDRYFMAAIARTVHKETFLPEEIQAKITHAREAGEASGKESMKWSVERLERNVAELNSLIANFQNMSGVKIDQYNLGKVTNLFKTLDMSPASKIINDIEDKLRTRTSECAVLQMALKELQATGRRAT